MKPIETRYAGCRFRSRLEARWAVFLDHLDIRWDYEPQGFVVPFLDRWGPGTPYLIDFWLPDLGIWVEVKGAITATDRATLLGATWDEGLPADPTGQPLGDDIATRGQGNPGGNRNGPRIVVLGAIPDQAGNRGLPAHHVLWHWKGAIHTGHAAFTSFGALHYFDHATWPVYTDGGDTSVDPCWDTITDYCVRPSLVLPDTVANAYRAARSARFEHGARL